MTGVNEHDIVYDPILDHWTCALTDQANGWIEIMAPDGQRVRRQVDRLTPAPVGTMVIAPRGGRSCNGCGRPAIFDAATRKGRWGYWCASCFVERTHGVLGVGIGQRLVPEPPPFLCHAVAEDEDEYGSPCPVCGGNLERPQHEDGT